MTMNSLHSAQWANRGGQSTYCTFFTKVLAQKCQFGPNSQQKPSHDLFELNLPLAAPKADLVDFPGLPGSVD